MVRYMDKLVGRIVEKIDAIGQLDNTIILFTADNGTNVSITSQWNGMEVRGGKGGMTDMGTHVPFIAYWKGHTPNGASLDRLIEFTDFYPTLAEAAGITLTEGDPVDGLSFYDQLVGKPGKQRDWVLCHYQPYWNKDPGQFVRNQDYKLYRDGRFFHIGGGDLKEEVSLSPGTAGEVGERIRAQLQATIKKAPPPPMGKGSKDTVDRPTYPDWANLLDPND